MTCGCSEYEYQVRKETFTPSAARKICNLGCARNRPSQDANSRYFSRSGVTKLKKGVAELRRTFKKKPTRAKA